MQIGNKKYFIITRDKNLKMTGNPAYFAKLIRREFNENLNFDIYNDDKRYGDMLSQRASKIGLPDEGLICKTDVRSIQHIAFDPHGMCHIINQEILAIFSRFLSSQYYEYCPLKIIQQTSHKEIVRHPMFLFRYCYSFSLLEKTCGFYDFFDRPDGYTGYTIKKNRVEGRIAPIKEDNHVIFDLSSSLPDIINVSSLPSDLALWVSQEVKEELEKLNLRTIKFIEITPDFYTSIHLKNDHFPNYFKEIQAEIDKEKEKQEARRKSFFKRQNEK